MFEFIKRERIYVLLLFFILAINVMSIGRVDESRHKEIGDTLSTSSFEEIGITKEKVKDFFASEKFSAKFFKYAIVLGLFIFLISFLVNLGFIFLGKKISFKSKASKRDVSWGIMDLVKVVIIIIFTSYLIGMLEGLIFKVFHLDIGLNLRMMFNTFFIDISAAIVIFYFVAVKYREKLHILGLRFGSFFRNIISGITVYIFMLPVLLVILLLSIAFLNLLGYSPPSQPVFEVFMEEKRSQVLLFLTIFVSIFGPVTEEIFFRGFMYSAIKKHVGVLGAAVLSASIFSILHTNIVGFLPIMILGILLAYLYEATGSLVASITVHIVHNSIIVGFVFFIKELMK
ncbi:MAG: CPBP family intramembrane metalloprotease [Candidatus Omnitrophica bacterium]|nr:CPBP family intramembrane metalloprotease [Candidatus Omnitrophota bacterium]